MTSDMVSMETIDLFNRFFKIDGTLHPHVSVMDITAQREYMRIPLRIGFYAIALTAYRQEHIVYGRTNCDYSDGTLLFFAPGDVFHIDHPDFLSNITLLVFHKDLIEGLSLGLHIGDYSFFDYYKQEALHLSCQERNLILQHFEDIQNELGRPIDRHSRVLLCKNIELLLDHCVRFYERQFILREDEILHILQKSDKMLDEYFEEKRTLRLGLPTAAYCAEQFGYSQAYLLDGLKFCTGKTWHEYTQAKRISIAKRWLQEEHRTIPQITKDLGFSSAKYFCRLFKEVVGYGPDEVLN